MGVLDHYVCCHLLFLSISTSNIIASLRLPSQKTTFGCSFPTSTLNLNEIFVYLEKTIGKLGRAPNPISSIEP